MVAELMAGKVKLPRNARVTQNVDATLKERGFDFLLGEVCGKLKSLRVGPVVKGERNPRLSGRNCLRTAPDGTSEEL